MDIIFLISYGLMHSIVMHRGIFEDQFTIKQMNDVREHLTNCANKSHDSLMLDRALIFPLLPASELLKMRCAAVPQYDECLNSAIDELRGNLNSTQINGFEIWKKIDEEVLKHECDKIEVLTYVFPTCFEGARVMLTRGLSNHFQVSHTINMSSITPSGYRFGATYVGTKQMSPTEAYPILLGDIDPSGNLNATIIHQIQPNIQAKFGAQVQNSKFQVGQLTMNYKGTDYTASCTVANPDVINGTGVVVLHYLQAVTARLALGTELAYQKGTGVPGGEIALLSAAAKYSTDNIQISGTLGVSGVHLCYYQRASKQLQIGVELEANHRMQEAVASVGYQVDLPKSEVVFKGHIDSNWSVGAVLEKKLSPLPFTLALSGLMNHNKNQFRLGVGILIG